MTAKPQQPTVGTLTKAEPIQPAGIETTAIASAARERARVEARYLMALQRPRNMAVAAQNILAACDRLDFAKEARYSVPRGGKDIKGLSTRFAEEAARHIGNLLVDAALSYETPEQRVMKVEVTDLESNVTFNEDVVIEKFVERKSAAAGQEVLSSRMNSQNQRVYRVRATDDDLLMKHNSLVSKYRRNGILRHLSADVQEEALARIEATITGQIQQADKKAEAIARLIRGLSRLNVSEEAVVEYLGHPIQDMIPQEYGDLVAAHQAMKDGETVWDDVLHARLQATQRDKPKAPAQPQTASGGYTAEDAADDQKLAKD